MPSQTGHAPGAGNVFPELTEAQRLGFHTESRLDLGATYPEAVAMLNRLRAETDSCVDSDGYDWRIVSSQLDDERQYGDADLGKPRLDQMRALLDFNCMRCVGRPASSRNQFPHPHSSAMPPPSTGKPPMGRPRIAAFTNSMRSFLASPGG